MSHGSDVVVAPYYLASEVLVWGNIAAVFVKDESIVECPVSKRRHHREWGSLFGRGEGIQDDLVLGMDVFDPFVECCVNGGDEQLVREEDHVVVVVVFKVEVLKS